MFITIYREKSESMLKKLYSLLPTSSMGTSSPYNFFWGGRGEREIFFFMKSTPTRCMCNLPIKKITWFVTY